MHAPGNPFPPLKLLPAKDSRFTILLVGSTTTIYTAGKTNPLSHTRILHVDTGKQGILEIIIWDRFINDLPCRIITLPELGNIEHDASLKQTCIEAIKGYITPAQCIWFVAQLSETRLNYNEQNVIKWLTTLLGEEAWKYALVIFTHSNSPKDRWKQANTLKNTSEKIRAEISKYTGWDIAGNITSVPITTLDDIILDGKKWLPEFYEQVARHSYSDRTLASEKVSSVETRDFTVESRKIKENRLRGRVHVLTWCYITSAPIGVIGMCLYGFIGFMIGFVINILFWIFYSYVRILLQKR